MQSNRRAFLRAAGGAIATTSLAGCALLQGSGPSTATVGLLGPTSGPISYAGDAISNSAQILFDGDQVEGIDVEYTLSNTEGDPDTALSAAQELVEQEEVDVLSGTAISDVGSAIANYASNQNVPYVPSIPVSTSLTGSECRRTTFRLIPHTGQSSRAAGQWTAENLGSDAYMVLPDYNYGQTVDELQTAAVEANGGQIVERSYLPTGHSEWGSVIDDINSTEPDYVFMEMTATGVVSFLAQAANRGLSVPIAGQGLLPVLTGQLTNDQLNSLPETYYTGMRYHHQIDNGRNSDYVDAFESEFGSMPGTLAGMTYGGLEFIGQVLGNVDELSTDAFVDTAEEFQAETVMGNSALRACDHQGSTPVFIGQLTNIDEENAQGEFDLADPVPTTDLLPACSETGCSFE